MRGDCLELEKELEKRRHEALVYNIIFIAVAAFFVLTFFFIGIFAFVGIILDIVFEIVVVRKKVREFKRFYKENLVKHVLEGYIEDLYFDPQNGIGMDVISDTGMMMLGNRYDANDYISGVYKGTFFEQSDVLIQDVQSSGKNTTTVTYFQGRWMIFSFNKRFAYDMQIKENTFRYSKYKSSLFEPKNERFKKIDFEDSAFNSVFTTFAKDEHEAYYIVTPQFMQHLMEFNDMIKGDLLLCFVNNRLHLAINNNKDSFEPNVFRKINIRNEMGLIKEDLELIFKFVDTLKLDTRLFV